MSKMLAYLSVKLLTKFRFRAFLVDTTFEQYNKQWVEGGTGEMQGGKLTGIKTMLE